jgi:hypothetical protein
VEGCRDEVVFNRRIHLDNVSSLSTDVQVEDSGSVRNLAGSWLDVEDVRSVLESTSELSGIQSKLVGKTILFDDRVVLDRRGFSILGPVNESLVGSVSIGSKVIGRNVVSDSENAVAVILLDAFLFVAGRESPVEGVGNSTTAVSEVVVTRERSLNASRSRNTPRLDLSPDSVAFRTAVNFVVFLSGSIRFLGFAIVLGLDVLGFGLVEIAP